MAERRLPLSGGKKILPSREDLERLPFSFFGQGKRGRGAGGGGPPGPVQRQALWADGWNLLNSPTNAWYAAAGADLDRPYDYTSWNVERYLWCSFWALTYRTSDSQIHPWVNLDYPTYDSGFAHGPQANRLGSRQWMNGMHAGKWDQNLATILGDAGDGTGNFTVAQEWHHFAINHSWNGTLFVDGKRTWFNSNMGGTTWSTDPGSSNGIRKLFLRLGGHRGNQANRPFTSHFGVSNVSIFDPSIMDYSEFDDIDPISGEDHPYDRFVTWLFQNVIDDSKSGLIWGWPLQGDLLDVGPYGYPLTLNGHASAQVSDTDGTFMGPVF